MFIFITAITGAETQLDPSIHNTYSYFLFFGREICVYTIRKDNIFSFEDYWFLLTYF